MAKRNMDVKIVTGGQEKVYGRVPFAKLAELVSKGQISPQSFVRQSGTQEWFPITEVPSLSTQLPPSMLTPAPATAATATATATESAIPADIEEEFGGDWALKPSAKQPEDAEMDMAPMIDVTFLLLIFFMLTNSLANPSPMEVPNAVHGRGVTLEGQQLILIGAEGDYYLGENADQENRSESLDALLIEVEANAGSSTLDVIVNAHKEASYSQIRELVERLSSIQGLGDIMLGVEEQLE